ncbi:MAG: hypothetical protein KF833_00145 [Verrucomicrobiae bacterium]|nr:hypothetical protein [Verrucomicrobiae bacterium]
MTERFEVTAWCEAWRRATCDEARSMEAGAWDAVLLAQEAKRRLGAVWEEAEGGGAGIGVLTAEERRVFGELIEGERENALRLEECRSRAEAERMAAERSTHQLRRLHRGFIGQPEAGWECYS